MNKKADKDKPCSTLEESDTTLQEVIAKIAEKASDGQVVKLELMRIMKEARAEVRVGIEPDPEAMDIYLDSI